MSTTFEEPEHLSEVSYQRVVRAFQPVLILYAVLIPAPVLIALWRRAEAGQHVSVLNWMMGATVGLWAAGLLRLALRFEGSRRRYIQLRDDGLFLARRGVIALRRIVAWSLSSDTVEPRYTRFQVIYRHGFGRKRWSMLLDDDGQISQLRKALESHIPQSNAT